MTTPLQTPEFTPLTNKPSGVLSLQTIPMPADTNWSGDVFGGWLVGGWCHKWIWHAQSVPAFTRKVVL